jgi:hypothetical protein
MNREKLKQLNEELSRKTLDFENKVRELKSEIAELKSTCTHTRFVYSYGGNISNYAPTDDCYWINIHCLDCGMKKSFYDNDEQYHYWSCRQHDKDIELALSEEEYKLIKDKGLL